MVPRRAVLRSLCTVPLVGLALRSSAACAPPTVATEGLVAPPRPGPHAIAPAPGPATTSALSIADYVEALADLSPTAIARPVAGPGEVLVRVHAVALNPLDVALATGVLRSVVPFEFPKVLGWDLAGEVAELGEGVTGFTPGQAVYAGMGYQSGAFAEHVAVPVENLAAAPRNLDAPQCAALPLVACTTIQVLARTGLRAGHSALVLGGAGGVGSTAIQLLRHLGASRVVATASATKLDTIAELGAETIDYRREDWSERLAGADLDLVYDTVGDENAAARASAVLREGGHFVSIAARLGDTAALGSRHHFEYYVTHPSGEDLAAVTAAVEAGGVTPLIFERFAFGRIADAYARCAERVAVGKIVVTLPRAAPEAPA